VDRSPPCRSAGRGTLSADLEQLGTVTGFERTRLAGPSPQGAVALLGALLVRTEEGGSETVVRIVETEAYREDDPASHSFAGLTGRTAPMFEGPGTAYVYRSYGVHWCLNVTTEPAGTGAAALIRAAVAITGHERMQARRPAARSARELLRGPGRLAAALDLDAHRHDGGDLITGVHGLRLADDGWRPDPDLIVAGPRTGIRAAPHVPWRFHLAGVREVSPYRRHPRAVVH
jgi:DNA-3-methyladenine glycosylase